MRKFKFAVLILTITFMSIVQSNAQKGGRLKMWYDKPASNWNEALPLGNGRIAAMVFGILPKNNFSSMKAHFGLVDLPEMTIQMD